MVPPAVLIFVSYIRAIFSAMSDRVTDWVLEKALGWPTRPPVNKIDTHHHYVPPFYAKGILLYLLFMN